METEQKTIRRKAEERKPKVLQKQRETTGRRSAAAVAFTSDGANLTARITGEIDHHAARRLRETIDMEVYRSMPAVLTLDMSKVGFMDSAGLGLILGRLNLMTERKGVLKLSGLNSSVARILTLAGVERLPGLILPANEPATPVGAPAGTL